MRVFASPDRIVFLSALTAETEGEKSPCLRVVARHIALTVNGGVSFFSRLERGVDGVATADELMKAESEDGETGFRVRLTIIPSRKTFLNPRDAQGLIKLSDLAETRRGTVRAIDCAGLAADESVRLRVGTNAEGILNPHRKRVANEILVACRRLLARVSDTVAQARSELRRFKIGLLCFAPQTFTHHVIGLDCDAKKLRGQRGHLPLLFGESVRSSDRRRSSDALEILVGHQLAQPTHEHGDIAALPTAIGVEFVQHEELQSGSHLHELVLVRPREDQFEHHVIREQNIRGLLQDFLSGLNVILAGVAFEGHRRLARRVAVIEEFLQLALLTVGESVHRINDDRLNAFA